MNRNAKPTTMVFNHSGGHATHSPTPASSYKNNMLVDSDCSQILATCSRDINYKCGGTLRTPCLKEQKNALLRIEDTLILYANQKHVSFSK